MSTASLIYQPQGQFAFPRSYLGALYIRADFPPVFVGTFEVEFRLISLPQTICRITLDERFFVWSSNRWTLDHVFTDAIYFYEGGIDIFDLPAYVVWQTAPDYYSPVILVDTTFGANYYIVGLPPGPPDYWLGYPFAP